VVLVDLLPTNADIFAWSPSDMPSIPREVTEHCATTAMAL
jgi:hypothetical protein